MSVNLRCPKEGCSGEIEVEFWDDVQGEGCYSGYVCGVKILNQTCSCEMDQDDINDLTERADVSIQEAIVRYQMRDFE